MVNRVLQSIGDSVRHGASARDAIAHAVKKFKDAEPAQLAPAATAATPSPAPTPATPSPAAVPATAAPAYQPKSLDRRKR